MFFQYKCFYYVPIEKFQLYNNKISIFFSQKFKKYSSYDYIFETFEIKFFQKLI